MTHWAVEWRSVNRRDGAIHYYVWRYGLPLIFHTRASARAYIERTYGYRKERPDLKAEPFGWKMPRAVKVEVILQPANTRGASEHV